MADRNDEAPKNAERKNFDDLSHLNGSDGEALRQSAEQPGTPRAAAGCSCEPVKVLSGGTLFDGLLECYVDADGNAYVTNRGTFRAERTREVHAAQVAHEAAVAARKAHRREWYREWQRARRAAEKAR